MTFVAVVATLAHSLLSFYQSFMLLSARTIITQAINEKKTISKLLLFPKYLIYRVRMLLGITKHLIIALVILSSGLVFLFFYFNKLPSVSFRPKYVLSSVPIFVGL
jgi:hypothetical protein